MNSDFIRFNDQSIFCDKITRNESIFNKFGDVDFIKCINNKISLINYRKTLYFDYVFHMTGCFSKVWTHFLVQFYPKLDYLYLIPKNEKIAIILPNDIDPHIISLIEYFIQDLNNIKVILVNNDTEVYCKKVMYISIDTWLSDDGLVKSMFHIKISDHTVKFVLKEAKKLTKNILISNNTTNKINKKLFIGRKGKRNIDNYSQVLEYFKSLGFVEIFPHLLTIEKKIELFSSAEFITGPASSGFANIIFCTKKPQVLVLINISRHDDMLLTKFAKMMDLNYQTFIGNEKIPGYYDSDYNIDMVELNKYVTSEFLNLN
jgi:capsular polysaccharide biosynthesis protein